MDQQIKFRIKEIETRGEKNQLIAIFRDGHVGGNYDGEYDKEYIAVDENGNVLGGMQVDLHKDGRYKGQQCPTYVIHNIGLTKRFRKKRSGLGTALIKKLKEECSQYNARAIAITSGRASELVFRNGFELLYAPDFWLWCTDPECGSYPNCVRKKEFMERHYSRGYTDERILDLANYYPTLAKYLKQKESCNLSSK